MVDESNNLKLQPMKKFYSLSGFVFIFITIIILGLDSCKKEKHDPDYCTTNWYTTLESQITAVTNAAMAYGLDQTTANCNAYKSALSSYIDALEPFGECSQFSAETRAQWQQMIDESRADLASACQ